MSDIFISYNNKDKAKAELFARAFERESWSVFWDKAIPPGKTFDQYINEQLEAAKCVVVLWSEGSVNSDWVKEEAQRGVQRKILVPVFINKVTPPLGFGRIEAAELFDWEGDTSEVEFQNLLKAIEALIHRHTGEETLEDRTPRSSVGAPPSTNFPNPEAEKRSGVQESPRRLSLSKNLIVLFAVILVLAMTIFIIRTRSIDGVPVESSQWLIVISTDPDLTMDHPYSAEFEVMTVKDEASEKEMSVFKIGNKYSTAISYDNENEARGELEKIKSDFKRPTAFVTALDRFCRRYNKPPTQEQINKNTKYIYSYYDCNNQ